MATLIKWWAEFERAESDGELTLTDGQFRLYFNLVRRWNALGRPASFTVAASVLQGMARMERHETFRQSRIALKDKGLIDFMPAPNQHQTARYSVLNIVGASALNAGASAEPTAWTEPKNNKVPPRSARNQPRGQPRKQARTLTEIRVQSTEIPDSPYGESVSAQNFKTENPPRQPKAKAPRPAAAKPPPKPAKPKAEPKHQFPHNPAHKATYARLTDAYKEFCEKRGHSAVFGGAAARAMRAVAQQLLETARLPNPRNGAIPATDADLADRMAEIWQGLLANWQRQSPYRQGKATLPAIAADFGDRLIEIRNSFTQSANPNGSNYQRSNRPNTVLGFNEQAVDVAAKLRERGFLGRTEPADGPTGDGPAFDVS